MAESSQPTYPSKDETALQSYTYNDKGERVIAATRRPDGTIRKEIRVKDGYVPPEEQLTYTNRAVQVRKAKANYIPGLDPEDMDTSKPTTKAAKKNAKRRSKRQ